MGLPPHRSKFSLPAGANNGDHDGRGRDDDGEREAVIASLNGPSRSFPAASTASSQSTTLIPFDRPDSFLFFLFFLCLPIPKTSVVGLDKLCAAINGACEQFSTYIAFENGARNLMAAGPLFAGDCDYTFTR